VEVGDKSTKKKTIQRNPSRYPMSALDLTWLLWFVYRRLLIIFLGLINFLVSLFLFISGQGAACF
jgi:hypothetical protein